MRDTTILVIDDDPTVRALLRDGLEEEGARVLDAADGAEALLFMEYEQINLITLDLDLGDDHGFGLARLIRAKSTVPMVLVTAKDDVIDRVVGLELGADDYIIKPFHIREVVARLRAILRRVQVVDGKALCSCDPAPCQCGHGPLGEAMYFDGMIAVPSRFELIDRDGVPSNLTSGDFKLLNIFLTRPKRVLTRDQLAELAGGHSREPLDRTVDNQVARLRKKIERDTSDPHLIKTVRGVGYVFACDVSVHESKTP